MSGIKENFHIGCVVLFIIVAILFVAYSIPKLRQQESKTQQKLTGAQKERIWEVVDSVHRAELMKDPMFLDIFNENEALKQKLEFIRATADDMQEHIDYFENKGFNVSDMQDIIDNIISESEY